ncbi:MAG: hypothetical protein KTR25_05725 [Myxococcales bacterium]|nr:hypothetical protein [Myxococcales bacterium]
MKRPDHEKSLLGHVPPGTLASSSERFTKSRARQLHTWPNQPAANETDGLCAKPTLTSASTGRVLRINYVYIILTKGIPTLPNNQHLVIQTSNTAKTT